MSDAVLISLITSVCAVVSSTIAAILTFLNGRKVNEIGHTMTALEKNTNNKMDQLLQAKDELRTSTNAAADAEGFKRGSEKV